MGHEIGKNAHNAKIEVEKMAYNAKKNMEKEV